MTKTGFLACDDCGGPAVVQLSDLQITCPGCGWDGFAFARSFGVLWCWRCGHEWAFVHQITMKEAH
jgi:ribosomal protein S27E